MHTFSIKTVLTHFQFKFKQLITIILGISLVFPLPAADRLQELMQMDLAELLTIEVFSASLFPEALMTAPGTVTVVTDRQIRQRGYRHLGELLSDLPGVDINHFADGIAMDVISFRGISGNNKVLLLQDGIRINSPSSEPIPIANNFPLYHVKQVEVISGPGSALYGADAFSAVINLVTYDYKDSKNNEVLMEAGDYGNRFGYFTLHEKLGDKIKLNLGGHMQISDNPDLDNYYPAELPNNGLGSYEQPTRSHSINLTMDWGEQLKLGYSRNYIRNPTSAGAHTTFVDYSANAEYRSLVQTAYARLNFDLAKDLNLILNFDHSDYEIEPESEFVNLFTDLQHQGYKYASGSRTQFEPRLMWQLDEQRIVAGVSAAYLKAMPKSANLPSPYDGNVQYYLNTDNNLAIENFKVEEYNVGGYLQLTSQWDAHWATTLGTRYDHHSTYGDSFTPRASITFAQNKMTSWELSYSESFLAPSPFHRFENYGSFAGDIDNDGIYESWFMHVPNQELQPEELKAIEISINHQPTPSLSLGAVLYHQKVEGIITATDSQTIQSNFVPGGEIFFTTQNDNIGELDVTGLELTSTYSTRLFNAEAKIWGNAAIVDGSLDEFGTSHDLPYTSNIKLKSGVTFNWNDKYILTTRIHWTGSTNGGVDTAGVDAPSHTLVHLHGQILDVVAKGIDLQMTVNNLFDQRYYESGDGSSGGGSGLDLVPQNPRWIKIALNYRF
jgi:outer membrane receptor for ferrienterochelin and colicin